MLQLFTQDKSIPLDGNIVTEDWRNNAENSALIKVISDILQYINLGNNYFKM